MSNTGRTSLPKASGPPIPPATTTMPFRFTDHLIVDPAVGGLQPAFEGYAGLPAEAFTDQGIVAVAAADPLGGCKVVNSFQLYPGYRLDNVH